MDHGVAFAPQGWEHAKPSSEAFAFLRAHRAYAKPGACELREDRVFADGSALLCVGTGRDARMLPWPLRATSGHAIIDPTSVARIKALHDDGYHAHDLWWEDATRLPDTIHHDSATIFTQMMVLISAYGAGTARTTIALEGSSINAPGLPSVAHRLVARVNAPLPSHVQARIDDLCAWITPLLYPDPAQAVARKWTCKQGLWWRTTFTLMTTAATLDQQPTQHEAIRTTARIREALHARNG